jgi:hypothetical protein
VQLTVLPKVTGDAGKHKMLPPFPAATSVVTGNWFSTKEAETEQSPDIGAVVKIEPERVPLHPAADTML